MSMLKSWQLGFFEHRTISIPDHINFIQRLKKNGMQMLTLHDKSAEALYV